MTPTPSTGGDARADLLERLKKATGPDRELDAEILWFTSPERQRINAKGNREFRHDYFNGPDGPVYLPLDAYCGGHENADTEYTSSLDAALALVERVLPGWRVSLSLLPKPEGRPMVYMERWTDINADEPAQTVRAHGATPALALLIALLSALPADSLGQEETGK